MKKIINEKALTKVGAFLLEKNMDNTNEVTIKIKPDTSELDDAINKAKQLNDLLNEAMKLAGSIANTNLNIRISSEFDGNATELACITTE